METKELNLRITLDRRSVFLLLVLFFVSWHPGPIGSETLTLTTYYPAPYGGYASLLTTGNTVLARDGGSVVIGPGAAVDPLTIRAANTALSAVDGAVRTRFFSASSTGFGYAGTSTNHGFRLRTADADRMVITSGGEVQVVNDLRVSGSIVGSCFRKRYLPTSVQTACDSTPGSKYRVIGFYPDGFKRVVGFLPRSNTTSNLGTFISLGEDWGGDLLCCRVEVN